MERRTAVGIVAVLALVCLGMVGSVVYPFETATAHGQLPEDEQFTAPAASESHSTGRLVVDGEIVISHEGIVVDGGPRYERTVNQGLTRVAYQATPGAPVYTRTQIAESERAAKMRESIREDDDRVLRSRNHNGTTTTLIVQRNETRLNGSISGARNFFVQNLDLTSYELTKAVPERSVYEPQSGWYEGTRPYRITDATGEVVVDADTNAVISANLTRTLTAPAGSYAQYLAGTLVGDGPATLTMRFSFDTGDQAIERPSWVPDSP